MAEPNSSSDAEGTTMANGSGPSAESKTNVVANSEKKESSAKDDEVEGTAMMNGSGPSPKDKTSVVADSEKKENTGKKDEVEGTAMTNGSALPPEDMSVVPDSEKNGKESKTVEEEKDSDERADSEEKKHGEENDTTKAEDMDESKEDKKTEDVTTAEAEDVKMADVEVQKAMEVEGGVKEEEEEGGAKEEGQGGKEWEEEEGEEGAKEEEGGGKEGEEEGGEEGAKEEGGGKKREEGGGKEGAKEVENVVVEGDNGSTKKKVDGDKDAERTKKKRLRGQAKAIKKSKGTEHVTKVKNLLSSPVTSSIERPVRERKTVERLVEVIEKEPSREFQVEKGRGTPLKDIPNVAYKLAKKKPADIKLIHQTLFGRKGKAVNFKNHILQFSGFVWHESDEKQRAKMKEKLDKYVKDTLLDLCDLFDLPVSKANIRKEDLVAKLLDFLVAPHPTTEVILSEDKQSTRSRKRKSVAKESGSKIMEDTHKPSRKKRSKSEDTLSAEGKSAQEMDDEDDEGDMKDGCPYKGKVVKHSENEDKESESEAFEEDEHDEEDAGKSKHDQKKTPKQGSVGKEKVGISSKKSPKSPTATSTKNLTKSLSSKRSKAEHDDDVGTKVFSRKKRIVDSPKKKSTPRSEKKEKDTGKKVAKGRAKSEAEHPSKEELRKKICEILKEVDFNTATFTDILKQLAVHYKVDLTPRKASIKLLIQEELTKLAEAEEDEDDEDEEDAENEENGKPTGKKVEA